MTPRDRLIALEHLLGVHVMIRAALGTEMGDTGGLGLSGRRRIGRFSCGHERTYYSAYAQG